MTLEEFRRIHSELIEQYQFIEHHLEGIYSCLCEDKSFYDGLLEVEKDTIHRLLDRIRAKQNESGMILLADAELEKIEGICSRRNFWCHNCYVDLVFDYKTGGPKRPIDIEQMLQDLAEANEIRGELFKKKESLLRNKRWL